MKKLEYSPELVNGLHQCDINTINAYLALKNELENFHPCTLDLIFHEEKDGSLDFSYCQLKLKDTPVHVNKISRGRDKNEYHFSIDYRWDFKYIDWDNLKEIISGAEKEGITEPNNVYTLSAKKIQQWVDYLTKIHNLCASRSNALKSNVDAFLKSLEGLPVRWMTPNIQGAVVKNGIQFSFTINQNNGWITRNMSLHYSTSATVADFLALSDNKFLRNS